MFATNRGLTDVVIESDTTVLIKAVHDDLDEVDWEIKAIVEEIQGLVESPSRGLKLRKISRKANQVADWLSRNDFLVINKERWSNMPCNLVRLIELDLNEFCSL